MLQIWLSLAQSYILLVRGVVLVPKVTDSSYIAYVWQDNTVNANHIHVNLYQTYYLIQPTHCHLIMLIAWG